MVTKVATKYFLILISVVGLLRDSLGSPKIDTANENGKYSSYENLIRRLEEKNYLLRHSLIDRNNDRTTVNEVDSFDNYYMMDQRAVQRAWSRDRMKKHQNYMNTHFVKLATENMKMVLNTAKCDIPTRRCLDVNRMDFSKPKTYWPNCAIVHKCGHDSGCCKHPNHVCSPVETENIDLYFFSIENNNDMQTGRVERLTFENHTRCDCRQMPENSILNARLKNCECPSEFHPVPSAVECHCDCDKKKSRVCRRVKRGKRSYQYKGCKGKCGLPVCDFGEFKVNFGRCPRKKRNIKGRRRK